MSILQIDDTIAAISTPYGTGGIGIVRISGQKSFKIASKIFKGRKSFNTIKSHTINYGKIIDPKSREILDEVLLSKMSKPHTFTREDMVEINCHGGMIVLKNVLELIIREGARLAEPGEFTKRAFLNGRIDLSQAEAVIDLINSKTKESSMAAIEQLEGKLSEKLKIIRKKLIELIAHIEVNIEYPEYDVEEVTPLMAHTIVKEAYDELKFMIKSFEKGTITGSPGCSSVFEKSMLLLFTLAGVPVLNLKSSILFFSKLCVSLFAGKSPSGPPLKLVSPIIILPLK
jgi:tRNA modification GTPase